MANLEEFERFVGDCSTYQEDSQKLSMAKSSLEMLKSMDAVDIFSSSDESVLTNLRFLDEGNYFKSGMISIGLLAGQALLDRRQCLERGAQERSGALALLKRLAKEHEADKGASPVALPMKPPEEPEPSDKLLHEAMKNDTKRKPPIVRAVSGFFLGILLAMILSILAGIVLFFFGMHYTTEMSNTVFIGCMVMCPVLAYRGQKRDDKITKMAVEQIHAEAVDHYKELTGRYNSLVRYAESERVAAISDYERRKNLVVRQCDAYVEAIDARVTEDEGVVRGVLDGIVEAHYVIHGSEPHDGAVTPEKLAQEPFEVIQKLFKDAFNTVMNEEYEQIEKALKQEGVRLYLEGDRLESSGVLGKQYWSRKYEVLEIMRDGLAGDSAEALRYLLSEDREKERDRENRESRARVEQHAREQAEAAYRQAEAAHRQAEAAKRQAEMSERAARDAAAARRMQEEQNKALRKNLDDMTAKFEDVAAQNADLTTSLDGLRGENENLSKQVKDLGDEMFYRNHGYYPD